MRLRRRCGCKAGGRWQAPRRGRAGATRDAPSLASHLHHYALPSRLTLIHLHHSTTLTYHTIRVVHSSSSTLITQLEDMCSKRKRSVDDSPLSISSYGAVCTPEAQSPVPSPFTFQSSMGMDIDAAPRQHGWDFASASRVKSSDWGNRTRKRFRDNRPDERAIHGMFLCRTERRNVVLIVYRKHVAQTLRCSTQPSRRIPCAIRHCHNPTTKLRRRKAAEINTTLFLETASCAARANNDLRSTVSTPAVRRTTTALRRLRHASAERK
jgi:hypothetical protein